MMSQFLFLLCLDWVIMKATADKERDKVEFHNSGAGP